MKLSKILISAVALQAIGFSSAGLADQPAFSVKAPAERINGLAAY